MKAIVRKVKKDCDNKLYESYIARFQITSKELILSLHMAQIFFCYRVIRLLRRGLRW